MFHGRTARISGRWRWTLGCCGLLVVAGCGSDGGGVLGIGGGGGSAGSQSLGKYHDAITADEAYHLLRRAAFGASPDEVQQAVDRGLTATVESLLTKRPESDTIGALAESYEDDARRRWLVYMLEGQNPLYERVALFWHDRFATSRRVLDGRDRNLAVAHWEMLRRNALGNYRQFLEELTIDPMMLLWLNGANSPKASPNENYAREFWELFTLGRDVLYTEADIKEGARAFTGITLLREHDQDARPIYDLVNHDETEKTIFPGREESANHSYLTVIDMTLRQPEAARYVARNLFECFIHDHPSDATVDDLARTFTENDFEIAPVVRRILTSEAMFSEDAYENQISSPVEHYVGVARTLDMHMVSEDSQGGRLNNVVRFLNDAGQNLLDPPGVEGWTEGAGWLKDQWIIARIDALGQTMEFGPDQTETVPFHLLPPPDTWDQREIREQLVDTVAGIFHLQLTDEEKAIYIEVLDQDGWLAFHLAEPDRQPRYVQEMIRLMAMNEGVMCR